MPRPGRSTQAVLVSMLAAALLTLGSSLIPRPIYQPTERASLSYGYPLPFLTQQRTDLRPQTAPSFIAWTDAPELTRVDWALAAINTGFYLTCFALARQLWSTRRPRS